MMPGRFCSVSLLFVAFVSFVQSDCHAQEARDVPSVEVGGMFSSTKTLAHGTSFGGDMLSGGGGRGVLNFTRHVGLDFQAGMNANSGSHFPFYLGCLKITSRQNDLNVFALAGAGEAKILRYEQSGAYGRSERFALTFNLGGGLEYVPLRWFAIRFDVADLVTRLPYKPGSSVICCKPDPSLPSAISQRVVVQVSPMIRFGSTKR